MRSVKKWIIGIIGSVIVIVVCAWIALELLGRALFGPIVETELLSRQNASRQLEYVLVEQDNGGGATVGFYYIVRLRPAFSDTRGEQAVLLYNVVPEDVTIEWQGNELTVTIPKDCTIWEEQDAVTISGHQVDIRILRK